MEIAWGARLVNIRIHQFRDGGAVVDAAALEQFQQQWATYQKLVDSDCLSHKAVGDRLGAALTHGFARPFQILDIACGDASLMRRVLPGTAVRHYHGIDLAEPALDLAAKNLAGVPFVVDLDHRDFVEAMNGRQEPADVAWCSLSIHHLPTEEKRKLLEVDPPVDDVVPDDLRADAARWGRQGQLSRSVYGCQPAAMDHAHGSGMGSDRAPCAQQRSARDQRDLAVARTRCGLCNGPPDLRRPDGFLSVVLVWGGGK